MTMLQLFFIGEPNDKAFQRVRKALGNFVLSDESPDFVLFFRSHPGQYTAKQAAEIKRKFPITPLLSIEASVNEGESRTGKPLAGVHSVLWYDFLAEWPCEYAAWNSGKPTLWSQSETAGADTLALAELSRSDFWEIPPCSLLISSDDYAYFALLRDIFRWPQTFWAEKDEIPPKPDFLFFDFPDFSEATRQKFLAMQKQFPQVPLTAFVEFPRIDEWLWLEDHGVTSIFPKPFRINDLKYRLSQI